MDQPWEYQPPRPIVTVIVDHEEFLSELQAQIPDHAIIIGGERALLRVVLGDPGAVHQSDR